MLTFRKGDAVKFVDEGSSIIETLKETGWFADGTVRDEHAAPRRGRSAKVQDSEQ